MNCPCEDCITLSLCKNLEYFQLFEKCSILAEYLPDGCYKGIRDDKKVRILFNILKPHDWYLIEDNYSISIVYYDSYYERNRQ